MALDTDPRMFTVHNMQDSCRAARCSCDELLQGVGWSATEFMHNLQVLVDDIRC